MAWISLLCAGVFEIAWALCLKYSEGFTRLWPTLAGLGTMTLSIACLVVSLRSLPLGTAYAIWTGIGAVGTAILGMSAFGEPADGIRVLCIALIVAGMVGLRLAASS